MTSDGFKIFGKSEAVLERQEVAITFGNFDGVHAGHQKLIRELSAFADGRTTVVFTFDPHPSRFFGRLAPKPLLMSLEQRVELLLKAGADCVYVKKFDEEFARLSADDFCFRFLPRVFNVYAVLLGFNFCYGQKREGCWTHFWPIAEKLGWKAQSSSPLCIENIEISSSKIRELLLEGNVELAAEFLGRPYALCGEIVSGQQRGRTIGFPTANLKLVNELAPADGVYACTVEVEGCTKKLRGVMNCGVRPTIGYHLAKQVEAHILDFDGNLYGRKAVFHLLKHIRSEIKFANMAELKSQIELDVLEARNFFERSGVETMAKKLRCI